MGEEVEGGAPQSSLLNYISKTQGEMEIVIGDPACVFTFVCGHVYVCKYHKCYTSA